MPQRPPYPCLYRAARLQCGPTRRIKYCAHAAFEPCWHAAPQLCAGLPAHTLVLLPHACCPCAVQGQAVLCFYLSNGIVRVGATKVTGSAAQAATGTTIRMVVVNGVVEWFCNGAPQGSHSLGEYLGGRLG